MLCFFCPMALLIRTRLRWPCIGSYQLLHGKGEKNNPMNGHALRRGNYCPLIQFRSSFFINNKCKFCRVNGEREKQIYHGDGIYTICRASWVAGGRIENMRSFSRCSENRQFTQTALQTTVTHSSVYFPGVYKAEHLPPPLWVLENERREKNNEDNLRGLR